MGTSLCMLIHKMAYGEFDLTYLIIGVVVGVLIIVVLIYRLCCYKSRVLTEKTTNTHNLQVTQVDIVRIPPYRSQLSVKVTV